MEEVVLVSLYMGLCPKCILSLLILSGITGQFVLYEVHLD
jgi:hypothetical protein